MVHTVNAISVFSIWVALGSGGLPRKSVSEKTQTFEEIIHFTCSMNSTRKCRKWNCSAFAIKRPQFTVATHCTKQWPWCMWSD